MAKERKMVDYGFTENKADLVEKGTLVVLDSFADVTVEGLQHILDVAEQRKFARIVFFPHNEKTLKAMDIEGMPAYHKRVKLLEAALEELPYTAQSYTIDTWEERRKKYTPMELILRYLQEKYRAPFFLYMNDDYANRFATFASFEECLQSVRLLIEPVYGLALHPKLEKHKNRWDLVE